MMSNATKLKEKWRWGGHRSSFAKAVVKADIATGGLLVPGSIALLMVAEEMVRSMKRGSVIVVAIDQGVSVETIDRVATHSDPYFVKHTVLHSSVPNHSGRGASRIHVCRNRWNHAMCPQIGEPRSLKK
jgi:alanine dehydrogenase